MSLGGHRLISLIPAEVVSGFRLRALRPCLERSSKRKMSMKKLFWTLCCFVLITQPVRAQSILLPVGSGPFSIELNQDATLAVVVNRNSNSVSIVNLADNTIKSTITVGTFPTSVAINPNMNKAVVTNFG